MSQRSNYQNLSASADVIKVRWRIKEKSESLEVLS
jgi:hypothetical protein